ncbi:MAG: rhomboid family intramembrane serine protease [Candidatus Limnocylindria bacterium]|jgi:membrane associated rhomboid family serine protease
MREARREDGVEIRQPPWITFALILLLVSSFVYARSEQRQIDAELGSALGEAEEYFTAHPYLTLPELLGARVGEAQAGQMRERFLEDQRSRFALPVPAGIQRREQERLEGLVGEAAGRLSEHPTQRWGMRAGAHRPQALLSHVLLHASWLHLLGSLVALFLLGFYLEGSWGASLFTGVVIGSLVAGASAFGALVAPGAGTWIGSSGLIAGLLGAFAVRFGGGWRDPSRALVFAAASLLLAVPLMIGVQWAVVREAGAVAASASWLALSAAFAFGAAAAVGIRVAQLDRVFGRRAPGSVRASGNREQLDRALEHRAAGRLDQSFTLLTNRLRQDPSDRDAALALWDVASDLGRPAAAAPALLGVIRDEIKRGASEQAVQHWLELAEVGLERDAEAALAIRMATLLAAADHRDAAAHALQHALARSEGAAGPALASRLARAASSIDPETAAEAAWRALGSVELTLAERQSLEGLLAEVLPRSPALHARAAPVRRPVAQPAAPVVDPESELLEMVDADPDPEPEAAPAPAASRAADASEAAATRKPDAIEIETASRTLEAIFAAPTQFDADGLCITASNGVKKRVRYDRIAAISVVAVSNLGPKPVILVDLILNWMSMSDEPLRIIRLRGDRFDPRRLEPDHTAPVDALRAIIARLLRESNATPLPDLQAAQGLPFAGFDDLASYHRDVLMVDGENAEAYAWNQD